MRILIIEDEAKTSAYLRKGLTENSFLADVAANGEEGLHAALGFDYFQMGYTAGLKAVQILRDGKSPGDIPSSLTKKLKLVVNPKAAEAQGLMLDEKFIKMADEVVK